MTDAPDAAAVPDALVDRDQWVCWQRQDRDGKTTKVPINPATGRFGSATDADTWSDFATARERVADGTAAGVGFVFTDADPFVGVDLDDCRVPETGTLTDEAAAIVDELDSYTEVSPSGTGVHVLVEGELPEGRNRHGDVECYETARFFTVTGDHVEGRPTTVEARPEALATVHETYVQPDSADREAETAATAAEEAAVDDGTASSEGGRLDDGELVERAKAAANGDKFARLWRGDTSGYESHSEADMALCALLSFWTGGDAERIDRLFRRSGLMREKWDEQHFADGSTYGEKTIERVLRSADEFYAPDGDAPTQPASDDSTESVPDSAASETAARTASPDEHREALQEQVEELRAQVERLERENQKLRAALEKAESDGDSATADENRSGSGWLGSLFSR
ncbi:phage NrS-1 polymerase family protein [Halorarius halobius]|uniref:phage NrS-1 polymerase family protein n=1 Tax=Halorarius halobius TaxID=2962671 RepID=UPI0020CCDA77|nr:hypothetical protein [Halorarius halobius]